MKLNRKYIPLIIGVAVSLGILIGSKLNFQDTSEKIFATNSKKDKLNRLIDYIDYEYVDKVNTDSIVDVTVNGILNNLDPHSVYIPREDYEDEENDMKGNFVGIGISFYTYKDSIAVIRAIKGGPSEEVGIKGGDRILYVDGHKLFGDGLIRDSITTYLKGKINTKVKLKVFRPGEEELLDFTIKRKEVPLVSVDASYKLSHEIGYIKINRFSEETYDEFKTALSKLIDNGISKLVLDLRNNPGGYIVSAENILDEFLEGKKLILVTRNKNGEEKKTYSTDYGSFENGVLYVLINENSASASEIIAGALQDNDKGTIIGRRSFGKGLVQRDMSLGDGSAVRLTIARYYTPTGRSIQRPYENGNNDYYDDYEHRYRNGELIHADSIKVADSLKFFTPKGKVVYGGGGIIPDVFVPKDTSIENETLQYLARSGYMSYFIFEFLERERSFFTTMNVEDFIKNYEVTEDLVQEFMTYSRFNEERIDLTNYEPDLKKALKANIAQQLFGSNAYECILNQGDPMLLKVLEIDSKVQEKD